ncbi:MAG: hypothetical protein H0T76_27935 [Nannocystis sp.]|nr:hypothetical protein [Nannocystis sp.]MBA3550324.1 hypothetical protein [Nannocystis sp.]
MRAHDGSERQLEIQEFARFEQAQGVRVRVTGSKPGKPRLADATVYGEDFALVAVRDGFYADDLRIYYVSRGRVYVVRSPRMRSGQGYRRISALSDDARAIDEACFDPDDPEDQATFVVADCIDGIE